MAKRLAGTPATGSAAAVSGLEVAIGLSALGLAGHGPAFAQDPAGTPGAGGTREAPVGHRQPTQSSVSAAEKADADLTEQQRKSLKKMEQEDARMKKLMGSICSNCGN
jgi:hypothetical protein